jgi:flagellar motor switch protein FliN
VAKKLRKFKLAGSLPRISRQQIQVTNALLCHLPQTAFESGFKEKLKAALEPLVHADVDVWFDGVRALAENELRQVLAEPTCAAIVGLPPRTEKALLEVDLAIAQLAIDKLLGGNAEDADTQRPLSEIEDGVFSYVLLKVLQLLQEDGAAERQVQLKLEGVHGTLASLSDRFPVDGRYVCLSFKLFFDVKVGFARLYLPESFVHETFPDAPPADGPAQQRWLKRLQDRMDLVSLLKAPLVVEVGRIGLQMADVEALDVEDIILVEETEVRIEGFTQGGRDDDGVEASPGRLTGRVQSRVGDGHRGIITGTVVVGDATGRYEVQIEAISPTGEPRPRAHLFRGGGDGGGDENMAAENSRALSAPGLVDADALAERMRRSVAARAAASGADCAIAPSAGRAVEHGGAEGVEGEHSDNEDGDEGPAPEAAGLLEDITVAMVVELGRVMVSAADVVQLRPGQVIELARAPGEPVDLVVDGKRIGKGELVEIDGELGVRILSLAR